MKITKDNIEEVLLHNGFRRSPDGFYRYDIIRSDNIDNIKCNIEYRDGKKWYYGLNYNKYPQELLGTYSFDAFLSFLNMYIDLKPLPEFDFVKYMCENGFTKHFRNTVMSNNIELTFNPSFVSVIDMKNKYPKNKETADIFISINKQLEGMKS